MTQDTSEPPVRVLVVDDQERFREVLRELVDGTDGMAVTGEACSGEEAVEVAGRIVPQLVVMDVRMPGIGGIEVARRLAATHPELVVVLISIEERIDVPSAAQLEAVPLVRKQEFGPRLLKRLWAEYGR
jgi:CheY-like chemotaxis protein